MYISGGWKGYRPFFVSKKIVETPEVTSFYLRPKDRDSIFHFSPGQYATVKIPEADLCDMDHDLVRSYSLSCKPGECFYRISVKRMPEQDDFPPGVMSNYLHQKVAVGSEILVQDCKVHELE